LTVAYAAMQFFFAPVVGALSDHFGRRPVLLASMAALALDYLLMSVAPVIGWLFLGRLIAGIAGATYPTANAIISDLHAPERRARLFGLIGAAWGIGFILGPALGGMLAGFSIRMPFLVSAVLAGANFLLGVAAFRETLPRERRRPFSIARAHLLGSITQLSHRRGLLLLLAVMFLYQVAHDALPSTWAFFAMRQFSWSESQVGVSLAVVGLTTAIVQGGLIAPIIRRAGEARAALLGFATGILSMGGYAFVSQGWMVYGLITLGSFFGLAMPAMQSMMSGQVSAEAQGELQGAIAGIQSVSAILAPVIMTQLFHWATRPGVAHAFPGAPMLLAAVLLLSAGLLFVVAIRRVRATAILNRATAS
ncbi:MAG: MFS transporter, partial [Proteobacteria bacterium]|nr:MFS transporter [Pseudomonadota bacterium]